MTVYTLGGVEIDSGISLAWLADPSRGAWLGDLVIGERPAWSHWLYVDAADVATLHALAIAGSIDLPGVEPIGATRGAIVHLAGPDIPGTCKVRIHAADVRNLDHIAQAGRFVGLGLTPVAPDTPAVDDAYLVTPAGDQLTTPAGDYLTT